MILLLIFAFLAGIVTILSPCILPILPIVLSGTVSGGKRKPFGIVIGFISSFTFFTLFLSLIVKFTGLPADALRSLSVIIIITFGLSLLVPKFQALMELVIGKFSRLIPRPQSTPNRSSDFVGGLLIGFSLGLVWTPCVGPILASVISLALSGTITSSAFFITLAYSLGTAIPMFAIIYGGRELFQKTPWLLKNSAKIQKAFGLLMIITGLAIATNTDRKFQTWILTTFPQYGVDLTKFEDNPAVKLALEKLNNTPMPQNNRGKPMFDVTKSNFSAAAEFIPGGQWFNSAPLTLKSLRGKVILVDFWTYTCINCIRTLPYLKQWHSRYKDKGLVIVGIHTPEFEFEKNPTNVAKAIKDFDIEYPIMQDNDYATWKTYDNHYWPAKYLLDKDGLIRYTHFGEGKYDETETMIQKLLEETGVEIANKPKNATHQVYSRTPELYLGYNRLENLFTNEKPQLNQIVNYSLQNLSPPINQFGIIGDWNIKEEWAEPSKGSSLHLQFESREVFLVMRPVTGKSKAKVMIRLDGQTVSTYMNNAGEDVTLENQINVTEDRLYKLIKLLNPGKHHLYLEFPDGNVELYAFTFG